MENRTEATPEVTISVREGTKTFTDLLSDWIPVLPTERWEVFVHPSWYRAFHETIHRKAGIKVLVAAANGSVVGILPLSFRRMPMHGLFLPCTEISAGRRSDYWAPVIKPGMEEAVLPGMMRVALKLAARSGVLILPRIPEDTSDFRLIVRYLRNNKFDFFENRSSCGWLKIEPTYELNEKKWSKSHRTDVRRQRKRILADRGALSLSVFRSKEEAFRHLPRFFAMHDKNWMSRGYPATFGDSQSRSLYHKLVDYLGDGHVHFSGLACGDTIIAYHFGFVSNGFLLYYKPTYDIDYSTYSPSKLLISYLIEEGIRRGWIGLDFLQGAEAYKALWASETVRTCSLAIKTKRISPAFFWITKGRPLVEKKIGGIYLRALAACQKLRRGPS